MDTGSFVVYIKTEDIYSVIAKCVKTRFDTSYYELGRPLPKGKNKKVIWLVKNESHGKVMTKCQSVPGTQSAISFFLIHWNIKLEIKFLFSFLYWSWDRKHQNKWFSDFRNNWTLKFKIEVCFSVFILIWKTKNQIYLNKYLMKLVTIPLTQS